MTKFKKFALVLSALVLLPLAYRFRVFDSAIWTWRYLISPAARVEKPMREALPPCVGCNLIFISMDTLRADRMGFLGNTHGLTPNLDRIAARSAVFSRAYTNAFYTTPSHMTMFTSLFPTTHQVEGDDVKLMRNPRSMSKGHVLDAKFITLAEILKKNGYKTFWDAPLRQKFLQLSSGFGRGFENFAPSPFDRGFRLGPTLPTHFIPSSLKPLGDGRKTFLFLHSYITHHPYIWREAPERIAKSKMAYYIPPLIGAFIDEVTQDPSDLPRMLGDHPLNAAKENLLIRTCTQAKSLSTCLAKYTSADRFWHVIGQEQLHRFISVLHKSPSEENSAQELAIYREVYDGGVRFLDRQIGEMWQELEASGALSNTMVVFVSDHGEELFENGQGSHSSFYEHTAHIPIFVYHPKLKTPLVSDQLVSLVDIMPTILASLEIPLPAQTQGKLPWLSPSPYVFGYALGNEYVRDLNWKLIRLYDGSEQLFYLPVDRQEEDNLIDLPNPWVRAAYARLSRARANWLVDQSL